MKKDDLVYVGHMLDMARSISAKVAGVERDTFDDDEILRLALVHLVQTIGEAAARASDEFRSAHPDIPWREIVGMRQKIVHDYIHVNYDIVWGVVTNRVPELIKQLESIVPDE